MEEQPDEFDRPRGRVAQLGYRALDWAWPGRPRRWADIPRRLRATLVDIGRLTAAAVLAFLLVYGVTGQSNDLTGPLTALLVVQASTYSTLKMGLVRVLAVLTGVLVAVLLSTWFGLSWWSLGLAVASALLLGRVLRLGDQMLEAPISAMLILAVHAAEVAVQTRVVSTLLGAAVGVAFGLLLAPAVPARKAAADVRRVADATAGVLRTAATAMRQHQILRPDVERWLNSTRDVAILLATASRRVTDVRESRKMNVWAIGTRSGEPSLRSSLETLEGVLRAVSALFTVLVREVPDTGTPEDAFGEEIRPAFATVLDTMAESILAFGSLAEAEFGGYEADVEEQFAVTLENLRESRAILTELMLVDPFGGTSQWLLNGSVLSAVEQTLSQLDVLERLRQRRDLEVPLSRATSLMGE